MLHRFFFIYTLLQMLHHFLSLVYLIDCGIAHCILWVRVDCESNAIPVHPITAGLAKMPDWLIMEAEETLENNIRGLQERQ